MTYRKHFYLIFLIFVFALSAAATFNYSIDPAQLFGKQYEKGIASIILKGKNVANLDNYDDRMVQKYYIENINKANQVIVLGSSRTMMIRSSNFKGQSFYNHSVAGTELEDDIAIFEMLHQRHYIPKTVVFGADAWLLNNSTDQRWKSLSKEFASASKRLFPDNNQSIKVKILELQNEFLKYKELISFAYLEASYSKWIKDLKEPKKDYWATTKMKDDVFIKLKDGSSSYDAKFRNRSVKKVNSIALEEANTNPIYHLEDLETLHKPRQHMFETFISDLRKKNINVILVISPYHPLVYKKIKNDPKYKGVLAAQQYFRKFGQEVGAKVVGSFDPDDLNLDEVDFYDGMHPKKEINDKLLQSIN